MESTQVSYPKCVIAQYGKRGFLIPPSLRSWFNLFVTYTILDVPNVNQLLLVQPTIIAKLHMCVQSRPALHYVLRTVVGSILHYNLCCESIKLTNIQQCSILRTVCGLLVPCHCSQCMDVPDSHRILHILYNCHAVPLKVWLTRLQIYYMNYI